MSILFSLQFLPKSFFINICVDAAKRGIITSKSISLVCDGMVSVFHKQKRLYSRNEDLIILLHSANGFTHQVLCDWDFLFAENSKHQPSLAFFILFPNIKGKGRANKTI